MSYQPWRRRRPKSILIDPNTGERHLLQEPTAKSTRQCSGGCNDMDVPRSHGSVEEAVYCNKLRALLDVGEIAAYSAQVAYQLTDLAGRWVGKHYVDFLVKLHDGREEVHEYKGIQFETWKLKRALFTHCFPSVNYRVLTFRDLT